MTEHEEFGSLIGRISFNGIDDFKIHWDLEELKQINLFIGPNNSGKSRMIREVFQADKNKMELGFSAEVISEYVRPIYDKMDRMVKLNGSGTQEANLATSIQNLIGGGSGLDPIKHWGPLIGYANQDINLKSHFAEPFYKVGFEARKDWTYKEVVDKFEALNWETIYIPTLRSLRSFGNEDHNLSRTIKDYFTNSDGSYKGEIKEQVFTGHSIY
ncbi:hypothetical protein [Pseudoalteromonas sp. McH1-42]|uniref:hypothetical protein n=1 Tax=Pseudoalteromonas sp. McH1-42 TaxID=2917752 RepID=UPI001EF73F0A|nr:hypothetical protein [Pseudoalteromonas sp. McH1-42]MCG7560999.1 hypothetical protein [Pseudoalteromonas sp. McH1-42]